ncbi:MAG: hypothetical protein LBL26_00315, partial [Peptococcaceae bacterium]|nr:hypothetical protein [Peptococcaceae bacterium]
MRFKKANWRLFAGVLLLAFIFTNVILPVRSVFAEDGIPGGDDPDPVPAVPVDMTFQFYVPASDDVDWDWADKSVTIRVCDVNNAPVMDETGQPLTDEIDENGQAVVRNLIEGEIYRFFIDGLDAGWGLEGWTPAAVNGRGAYYLETEPKAVASPTSLEERDQYMLTVTANDDD